MTRTPPLRIDGVAYCIAPGCPNPCNDSALYCSLECKEISGALGKEIRELLRLDRDAETLADLAERCRGCVGGAYCIDELGDCRCLCGFPYSVGAVAA